MTIDVLATGPSIRHYETLTADQRGIVKIGVNDAAKHNPVDYLVLLDPVNAFTPDRLDTIISTKAFIYSYTHDWKKIHGQYCKILTLAQERSGLSQIDQFKPAGEHLRIPYSYNSAFVATVLAYRLIIANPQTFKPSNSQTHIINLYGADFRTYSQPDGWMFHDYNMADFQALSQHIASKGIQLFTTPESALSAFIPVNPMLK